jgi:hypothetical protein
MKRGGGEPAAALIAEWRSKDKVRALTPISMLIRASSSRTFPQFPHSSAGARTIIPARAEQRARVITAPSCLPGNCNLVTLNPAKKPARSMSPLITLPFDSRQRGEVTGR